LILIFWDLGSVPEADEMLNESQGFVPIRVEEFDEEAEMQARIWNRFMRHYSDGVSNTSSE